MRRIEKRHKLFRLHEHISGRFESLQRIIILLIIISCIALIAAYVGFAQF
jgi:hypothetical protein